jgi:predicted alpha/beta superfamily hydrolase
MNAPTALTRSTALLMAVALLLVTATAAAQPAAGAAAERMQAIADTRLHVLDSTIVERPFKILVKLPADYAEKSAATYPVVYLLDGGAIFPMLAAYYRYLRFEEAVPDLIVVGLSYGSDSFEQGNYRSTDYTAPSAERDYWGGAADFLRVLETEVFPLVEGGYRAEPGQRILFGQSIGGQFVLFAALNKPDLFSGLIASNPALHRNLDYFLNFEFLNFKPGPGKHATRLFVASGSEDAARFREPALAWMQKWGADPEPPWDLRAITIDGYGHFSIAPESFRLGLRWILDGG